MKKLEKLSPKQKEKVEKLKKVKIYQSVLIRNIDKELITEPEDNYFPPIVNLDPITNVQDITKEDANIAYKELRKTFSNLSYKRKIPRSKRKPNTILEEAILFSRNNFLYFVNFYRELEKVIPESDLGFEDSISIPFNLMPIPKARVIEQFLHIQPPMYLKQVRDKYRIQYFGTDNITAFNSSPISLHRFKYVLEKHTTDEFYSGLLPSWYHLLQPLVVFKKYVPQINKHLMISFKDDQFYYSICGASDNWQKVYNVPLEIDDFIIGLLFRN